MQFNRARCALLALAVASCSGGSKTPVPDAGSGACDPMAATDGCNASGRVCVLGADGVTGTCQTPGFGDPCLTAVGCGVDGGLTCQIYDLGPSDGGPTTGGFCGTPCQTSTDCADPGTDCFALAGDGGAGGCQLNQCAMPYTLCQAGGSPRGGTCVPTQLGSFLCIQSGSAALGAPCAPTRADGGAYLCALNDGCLEGPQTETACYALCGSPGEICPSGTQCFAPDSLCLTPCTVSSACQSPQTCQVLVDQNGLPIPDAGSACLLP